MSKNNEHGGENDDASTEKSEVVRGDPVRRLLHWPVWRTLASRFEDLDPFDDRFLRVEEFRTDNAYIVRAEMPGLDPDKDFDVSVTDHTLHIEATRNEHREDEHDGRFRSEFRYGHFVRNIDLHTTVHADDVQATYKDGVLEVRAPIDRQQARASKVTVQRA